MHELCRFLRSKRAGIVCPSEKDLFEAFRLTPFEKVKVVILGQDPYPNRRQAMGLAFSIPPALRPHPLSLRNIYHELQTDLDIAPARRGDLTRWAEAEGVLLLNCTLTVRAGKAKSHRGKGWTRLTNEAIKLLNERREPVVFLLWGAEAKKKARLVKASRHKILCADHPAAPGGDFFGRSHFSKTNAFLKKNRLGEIDWRVISYLHHERHVPATRLKSSQRARRDETCSAPDPRPCASRKEPTVSRISSGGRAASCAFVRCATMSTLGILPRRKPQLLLKEWRRPRRRS
jgi:uracil-DNA glycosylase